MPPDANRPLSQPTLCGSETSTIELSSFQKEVLRDVLDSSNYFGRRRGIVGKWLDADQPRLVFTAALSWGHVRLTSEEDGTSGPAPIKVVGRWDGPLPGYPNGIDLDGVAFVTRTGSTGSERRPGHLKQWRHAVQTDGVYRPPTYVCRMTLAEDYYEADRAKCPERVGWYVSCDAKFITQLTDLASFNDRVPSVQVYGNDALVIHPTGMAIRFESPLALSELDEDTVLELMWWRLGEYVGVASGLDPRAVLLLLPGTRFAFRKGLFQVRSMNDGEVCIEMQQIANPYYRE